jgi:thioredoxin-like negative regulator of GroEL
MTKSLDPRFRGDDRTKHPMKIVLALLTMIVAGCAAVYTPSPGPVPESVPAPEAPVGGPAVVALFDSARTDSAAGRLGNAAASLERALRIEPRNPRLWQELARVRFAQGDYAQAESVARRSNSWAGGDAALRADNWRLIAQAREARGDAEGAKAALDAADRQR